MINKEDDKLDLNPDKTIFIHIISDNKPSYGVTRNGYLFQDEYSKQKVHFYKRKE